MALTEGWNNLDTDTKVYNWKKKGKKQEKSKCGEPVTIYNLNEKELEEYLKDIENRSVVRRK